MEDKDKLKDKYIDPFTDFGFKKLFGEECNKDLSNCLDYAKKEKALLLKIIWDYRT